MSEIASHYIEDYEKIIEMIATARCEAEYKVNKTMIDLYWNIGKYVSWKTEFDGWGRSTVKELSEYILGKEPGIRGYSS